MFTSHNFVKLLQGLRSGATGTTLERATNALRSGAGGPSQQLRSVRIAPSEALSRTAGSPAFSGTTDMEETPGASNMPGTKLKKRCNATKNGTWFGKAVGFVQWLPLRA